jgi:RimJ/RimL family protein N-acetyltransferase
MGRIAAKQYTLKTGEKVVIRTAVAEDAAALAGHARVILEEDLYNVMTLEEFDMTVEKEGAWIRQHLEHPGKIILLAELDVSVVGALHFENSSRQRLAHRGTIHMSVHPQHRRRGIGAALLDAMIGWARRNPVIEKVGLGVFVGNKPAIALYKKAGFVEEGRLIKEVKISDDKYVDLIRMFKFVKD